MTCEFDENIKVNITFLPQLTLRSDEQSTVDEIQETIEGVTASRNPTSQVSNLVYTSNNFGNRVVFTVTTSTPEVYTAEYIEELRNILQAQLEDVVSIRVRLVTAVDIEG